MISKVYVRKLLPVNRLQKSLYGRLSRRRYFCTSGRPKGPVPFRPTQRDYKRQEKLVSADSLSEIAFDDGLFKDEADLNGFVRWILRCQAKREAGTLEP